MTIDHSPQTTERPVGTEYYLHAKVRSGDGTLAFVARISHRRYWTAYEGSADWEDERFPVDGVILDQREAEQLFPGIHEGYREWEG